MLEPGADSWGLHNLKLASRDCRERNAQQIREMLSAQDVLPMVAKPNVGWRRTKRIEFTNVQEEAPLT